MLTLVTPQTQHIHYRALNESFRLRHRVLIGYEKWDGLEPVGDREIDAFDTEEAYYLLAHDEPLGPVKGCVRFVPSDCPTLSSEIFAYLFEGGAPPKGEHLFDVSRFVVDPDVRSSDHVSSITADLNCGWIEFGLAMGLEGLTAVVDYRHLQRYLALGISIEPLGLPQRISDNQLIAVCIETSEENAASMRRCSRRADPVLTPHQVAVLKSCAKRTAQVERLKLMEVEA